MWKFSGSLGPKSVQTRPGASNGDYSDDEASSCSSREESLECPICWESFNIVENVPYVLWCGHTLCKNCVLGLQCAVVKFPSAPIQLPFFISCPWCHLLSFRLVYKGHLKFPRKNFFLLWMVESLNGDRRKPHSSSHQHTPHSTGGLHFRTGGHCDGNDRSPLQQLQASSDYAGSLGQFLNAERINASLRKSLVFFVQLTAKFPLVVIFLLIVLYAVPASAAILALYVLITVLFALPSFLILYFAYPSLDWLFREIIN